MGPPASRGVRCHPEGPGEAPEVSPWEPHEVLQGQGQGPAPGAVSALAGGWRDGEAAPRRRT